MRCSPFAAVAVCLAVMPCIAQAQSGQNPSAPPAEEQGFLGRFIQEYHDGFYPPPGAEVTPAPTPSVCLQGPLDSPPFPSTNFSFGGNPGMCQDGTADRGPLIKALGPTTVGRWLDANRISLYGWIEPGFDFSSSRITKGGNAPAAYDFNANAGFLNQATFYIDRLPDTIQNDHIDWGFRLTNIYGTDYRYTTMYGVDSAQLLKQNRWAGWDLPMAYFDLYVPNIGYGTNFRLGRYISLPDIEAQLAPDNYFYSHSILYSTDPYTQIGLIATTRLDPKGQWNVQLGISAGNDVAPWAGHHLVQPTLTAGINYTSPDTYDNVYLTANSSNNQKFGYNNLQSFYFTYYHIFNNPKFHTATEMWYMFQDKTPNAPDTIAFPFYGVNGPFGAYCNTGTRCQSHEWAILNYTMYEIDRHNAIGIRNELYDDASGQRTGFRTAYYEGTIGWQHYFSDDVYMRPEIGYYHAFNAEVFSGATRKDLLMVSADLIWRY
jgi:hypothetical protein